MPDDVLDDVPLDVLELSVAPALLACCEGGGGGGSPPLCCEAAEKRSPRNCCRAVLIALDDVVLEESLVDAVELELELESVLVDVAVELLDEVSPTCANAAAIAAASGFVPALSVDVESLEFACNS